MVAENDRKDKNERPADRPGWLERLPDFFGLRSRLLMGLTVVGLTLTVSVGYVVLWAVERQLRFEQERTAAQVADTAAALCSAATRLEKRGLGHPLVRRVAGEVLRRTLLTPGTVHVVMIDRRQGRITLGDGRGIAPAAKDRTLKNTLRSADITFRRVKRKKNNPRGPGTDLYLYRRIGGPGGPAAIRVVFAAETGVRSVMSRARTSVWILGALDVVLLLLLAGIFLTRSVVRPIRDLEQAARKVAAGRLDPQVEGKGEAEIGRLARAFNAMTERLRQNEETLKAQIDQLEAQQRELDVSWEHVIRAEKFASVGRLAAGVAHEVGNPLTALVGYAEILKDTDTDQKTQAEFVERMERELKRMDTIIHGLLDYSRQEQAPVGPYNLREIARTAAELVKPQEKLKRVDIKLSLPSDLPKVQVSTDKLIQVFVNLLLNAADAINGQGEVTIESRPPSGDADTLDIVLRDTGPGVNPEIRDKIFDPFFTTKDVGRGTGLGLAICQSILQTMEGNIELLPHKEGSGAAFKITLKTESQQSPQDGERGKE